MKNTGWGRMREPRARPSPMSRTLSFLQSVFLGRMNPKQRKVHSFICKLRLCRVSEGDAVRVKHV